MLSNPSNTQKPNTQKPNTQKPTVGLALGGGGMRGLAHIGVLKVLERAGIRFDCLAGTSMGGIACALYATGMSVTEIEEEALRLANVGAVLKLVDWAPAWRALIQGHNIYNYLDNMLGADRTFDELDVPLALSAVDLVSWKEVVLKQGKVIDALRASIAIPGVFMPFELDGKRLVDGGFLNNVPADLVRQLGADIVIAVDVGIGVAYGADGASVDAKTSPLPNFMPAIALDLWQINAIMIKALTEHKLKQACPEFLLLPKVPTNVGLLSGWNKIEETIAAGETAAEAMLPKIREIVHGSRPAVEEA